VQTFLLLQAAEQQDGIQPAVQALAALLLHLPVSH
jgi:hypothetical protein